MGKSKSIILSDLHIDTWETDARRIRLNGKTREEHFHDFLEAKRKEIDRLYIVGDLLDLPPEQEGDVFPKDGIASRVFKELIALSGKDGIRIFYVFGNHDIGASGLTMNQECQIPWLGKISTYYPRLTVKTPKGKILLEHGHFYDPALALYADSLLNRTYIGRVRRSIPSIEAVNEKFNRSFQRRDGEGSTPKYGAKTHVHGKGLIDRIVAYLSGNHIPTVDKEIKDHWAGVARRFLEDSPDPEIKTVVYGHTHLPEHRSWDDLHYFNSGDWCGETKNTTYLEVDEEGNIALQNWVHVEE